MRKCIVDLLGVILLVALMVGGSRAAEFKPRLDFDFSLRTPEGILDQAGSGLVLKPGTKTRFENEALVFDGSEATVIVVDEISFRAWVKGVDLREISGAFWIRFDTVSPRSAPSKPTLGIFDCRVGEENFLELALATAPTELMASELVLRSKTVVEQGRWYHVEFNYSANRRRYSLYIDGFWQMENDQLVLPELALGPLRLGDGFHGAIKDLKFYDAALESEALAIANAEDSSTVALQQRAAAIAADAKNADLKSWATELALRAETLGQNLGRTTLEQHRHLGRDIANAEKLATGLQDESTSLANSPVTSYILPATTQDLLQPYDLPRFGKLSRTLNLYAAQGEFESALVVVVPFRPIKNFTIRVSDLRHGATVIPATAVDPKIVKRWYRTGGAWMSYHADKRQRVLVPDLLINDDSIMRVDEIRASNELLMRFPRGDKYVDVSRYDYEQTPTDVLNTPFRDATSLQPLELPEAGRNQPYCLTFHVPEEAVPGLYTGTVALLADGLAIGALAVNLRVLPFVLPDAKTYYDISRTYYSHINYARTDSPELFSKSITHLKAHNLLHASRVAETPWQIALAKEAGYPLQELIERTKPLPQDWKFNFGGPGSSYTKDSSSAITTEDQVCLDRLFKRDLKAKLDFFDEHIGPDVSFFNCVASERSFYGSIVIDMEQGADAYHETGRAFLMTHGMTADIPLLMGVINDMDSTTRISREWADLWHAVGGRIMNYANPFPSAENPAWFRRRIGLQMYKDHYDGQMLHGYLSRFWNEFAEWPGGDGNYRNFSMVYPQQNGVISTLSLIGVREAYDDVRYATKLQELALPYRDSKNMRLANEAKRQLHWLARIDGERADMDAFRAGAVQRILAMMELVEIQEGDL